MRKLKRLGAAILIASTIYYYGISGKWRNYYELPTKGER